MHNDSSITVRQETKGELKTDGLLDAVSTLSLRSIFLVAGTRLARDYGEDTDGRLVMKEGTSRFVVEDTQSLSNSNSYRGPYNDNMHVPSAERGCIPFGCIPCCSPHNRKSTACCQTIGDVRMILAPQVLTRTIAT